MRSLNLLKNDRLALQSVVYLDQRLGAANFNTWSKQAFSKFLRKTEKRKRSKKFGAKFSKKLVF